VAADRVIHTPLRRYALFGAICTIVIVAGVAFAVTKAIHHEVNPSDVVIPPASTVLGKGASAPVHYTLPALVGPTTVNLAAALHGRPGVVNFFASWCTACQAELSAFEVASTRLGASVAFVGIDTNDTAANLAASLAHKAGVHYPLGQDTPSGAIARAYGVSGLPTTFVIDSAGRVRWETLGAATASQLEREIAPLLAHRTR
jgi:thiol-disulfide isomerase/thioredoxin